MTRFLQPSFVARHFQTFYWISSILIAVCVVLSILTAAVQRNRETLELLNGHIASFVETQDRPELQRLLGSIRQGGRTLEVVDDGVTIASSDGMSGLDRPYLPKGRFQFTNAVSISLSGITTRIQVSRNGGSLSNDAVAYLTTPLLGLLFWAVSAALIVLYVGLYFGRKLGETLAEKRAKELATDSYRRLIHDLHNPVSALGVLGKLASNEELNADDRIQASRSIPQVAEQILSQINAAKENLEFEAKALENSDIRECVRDATDQARLSSVRYQSIQVNAALPAKAVVIAHDKRLIRRAVGNLVRNAIDACKEVVEVQIEQVATITIIRVVDDGPGLTQEQAGLYLQGRGRSTKGDRHAHGLAAVNHITREHGGRIVYSKSKYGGGCFEIRLGGGTV